MADLTREQVEEWLRIAEAATPGPWSTNTGRLRQDTLTLDDMMNGIATPVIFSNGMSVMTSSKSLAEFLFIEEGGRPRNNKEQAFADADFCASARTAIPALCRALLEALESLELSHADTDRATDEALRWRAEALAARNVLHWYRASNTPSVDAEVRYASARAANGEE